VQLVGVLLLRHHRVRVAPGIGVAPLLQPAYERDVVLAERDVDSVERVVDGAVGVGVVEALDQRVELVGARRAHDLPTVEVVAHVVEAVVPLEWDVADRVDGRLVL